jgi:hypothetical protein
MSSANTCGGVSTTIVLNSEEKERSEPTDETIVIRDNNGTEYPGKVTCGTFSTIVAILDRCGPSRETHVEVDYGGVTIPATVRRAYERPDGKYLITLRWGG